jgi:nitroreductase
MAYFDVIEKRFSCRSFKDEKIDRALLNKVLEAGRLAPTACNYQPERIFVCESEEVLSKLKVATRYTFDAKTILIICHLKSESWHRGNDGVDHGKVDSTIVATQMVLASTSLGLGTCFVCSFKEALVKEVLGINDDYEVDIILPIGYPNDIKPHNQRKDLKESVCYK